LGLWTLWILVSRCQSDHCQWGFCLGLWEIVYWGWDDDSEFFFFLSLFWVFFLGFLMNLWRQWWRCKRGGRKKMKKGIFFSRFLVLVPLRFFFGFGPFTNFVFWFWSLSLCDSSISLPRQHPFATCGFLQRKLTAGTKIKRLLTYRSCFRTKKDTGTKTKKTPNYRDDLHN